MLTDTTRIAAAIALVTLTVPLPPPPCPAQETTPIDAEIPEQTSTEIACKAVPQMLPRRFAGMVKLASFAGIYHYTVYLPAGYNTDTDRQYPCIFVASPGGNAKVRIVKDFVDANKWIAIMLVESKNGPWTPIFADFLASHDDAVKRLRIIEGMKFATGMSGGGLASNYFVRMRKGFGGIIFHCNPSADYQTIARAGILIYGLYGTGDFNNKNVVSIIEKVAKHNPQIARVKLFEGKHSWAPREDMAEALAWMQKQSLVAKGRTLPDGFLKSSFENLAAQVAAAGSDLEKYTILERMNRIVMTHRLRQSDLVKDTWEKYRPVYGELRKDIQVRREYQAMQAYENAAMQATYYRVKFKGGPKARAMKARLFTAVADKFTGTAWGDTAQQEAGGL